MGDENHKSSRSIKAKLFIIQLQYQSDTIYDKFDKTGGGGGEEGGGHSYIIVTYKCHQAPQT